MLQEGRIWVGGKSDAPLCILPAMANRHGLIAGATGTGKTVTLKVIAESFSEAGVPVFLADVKGDLAGMCRPGEGGGGIAQRLSELGLSEGFSFRSYPTVFWDVFGKKGLPLRTTVSEFGPLLLSRLLNLNQTQSDILNIIFKIADEEGLLLLDLKDLKSMLHFVGEHGEEYRSAYGNIAKQSVSAILRGLVSLGEQGGDIFFGEPALDIHDWFSLKEGLGVIHILEASNLIQFPVLYAMFMLWMLSELYEILPEAGDLEKPKIAFFFDEAHLLFKNAPKVLLEKIEQVMRLIRSKGVAVFFITQNPKDIPSEILGQLGNKVQHALRAFTPEEQKGVRAAAKSYRANPAFDTEEALLGLKTGEALISFLQEDGSPAMVERAMILPPRSQLGAIDDMMRAAVISISDLQEKYKEAIDRDSAYEFLQRLSLEEEKKQEEARQQALREKEEKSRLLQEEKEAKRLEREQEREQERAKKQMKRNIASVAGTAAGTLGRQVGKSLGSAGGNFGKSLGGNVGASLGRGILKTLFKL